MSFATEHQEPVMATITTPDSELADHLAVSLVEQRLAACVQIINPVKSVYRWQGSVEIDREVLLLVKTTRHRIDEITRFLAVEHPYDVPELVAVPIVTGDTHYLNWLIESVE